MKIDSGLSTEKSHKGSMGNMGTMDGYYGYHREQGEAGRVPCYPQLERRVVRSTAKWCNSPLLAC